MQGITFKPMVSQRPVTQNPPARVSSVNVGSDQVMFGATRRELLQQQRAADAVVAQQAEAAAAALAQQAADAALLEEAQAPAIQAALEEIILPAKGALVPAFTTVDLIQALTPHVDTFEAYALQHRGNEASAEQRLLRTFMNDLSDDEAEQNAIRHALKNKDYFFETNNHPHFFEPIVVYQDPPREGDIIKAGKVIGYKPTALALKALEVMQTS